MSKDYNLMELLKKHLCAMTGEEFVFLFNNLSEVKSAEAKATENKAKNVVYGIEGIACIFGCSKPTASRIKKSGIIDDAITQINRKIIVDVDKALELAAKVGRLGKEDAA